MPRRLINNKKPRQSVNNFTVREWSYHKRNLHLWVARSKDGTHNVSLLLLREHVRMNARRLACL